MEHALKSILEQYMVNWQELKTSNDELDPFTFQMNLGFQIKPPDSWPVYECMAEAIKLAPFRNVVVIYSSTQSYKFTHGACGEGFGIQGSNINITYFSWHELYYAMQTTAVDTLNFNRLKSLLVGADCVFFLDMSRANAEVVNQVKGTCECCLIGLG